MYTQYTCWWLSPTPLKNIEINWDDDIPKIDGKAQFMFQTTSQ